MTVKVLRAGEGSAYFVVSLSRAGSWTNTHSAYGWAGSDGKGTPRRGRETPLCTGSRKSRWGDSKSAPCRRVEEALRNWGDRKVDGGRGELRKTQRTVCDSCCIGIKADSAVCNTRRAGTERSALAMLRRTRGCWRVLRERHRCERVKLFPNCECK